MEPTVLDPVVGWLSRNWYWVLPCEFILAAICFFTVAAMESDPQDVTSFSKGG